MYNLIAKKCKVLSVDKKTNKDGSINWTEVTFMKDGDCLQFTIDSEIADSLKLGSMYDFILQVIEQNKSSKDSEFVYKARKFKIVGIDS